MKNIIFVSTCCVSIFCNIFNAHALTTPRSYRIKPAKIYTKDFNKLYFLLSMGHNIHELEVKHLTAGALQTAVNKPLIMNFSSLYGSIGIGYGGNYKSLYGSIECMLDISTPKNKTILSVNSNNMFSRNVKITHNFVKPNLGIRVGYLKNSWLLYAKLGLTRNSSTITDSVYQQNVTVPANPNSTYQQDVIVPANMVRYMPTIALGIEHSFSKKFSFRVEGEFTKSNFGQKLNAYTQNNPQPTMKFRSNNINIKLLLSYYYSRRLKHKYL